MYDTPNKVEKLTNAIIQAKEELIHLYACKESNQPDGKKLDTLLVDAYANLATACDFFTLLYDDIANDLRKY